MPAEVPPAVAREVNASDFELHLGLVLTNLGHLGIILLIGDPLLVKLYDIYDLVLRVLQQRRPDVSGHLLTIRIPLVLDRWDGKHTCRRRKKRRERCEKQHAAAQGALHNRCAKARGRWVACDDSRSGGRHKQRVH